MSTVEQFPKEPIMFHSNNNSNSINMEDELAVLMTLPVSTTVDGTTPVVTDTPAASATAAAAATATATASTPVAPVKPKRCLTAYNIFFRDERQKLLAALPVRAEGAPKYSHGKISFKGLASRVSASWKVISDADRAHYDQLAAVDKIRHQQEMSVYKQQLQAYEEEVQAQAAAALTASIALLGANNDVDACLDLPLSLERVFDDHDMVVEQVQAQHQYQSGTTTPYMREHYTDVSRNSSSNNSNSSHHRRSPSASTIQTHTSDSTASSTLSQAYMEQVFGALPAKGLLGSIVAADHEWPV